MCRLRTIVVSADYIKSPGFNMFVVDSMLRSNRLPGVMVKCLPIRSRGYLGIVMRTRTP